MAKRIRETPFSRWVDTYGGGKHAWEKLAADLRSMGLSVGAGHLRNVGADHKRCNWEIAEGIEKLSEGQIKAPDLMKYGQGKVVTLVGDPAAAGTSEAA